MPRTTILLVVVFSLALGPATAGAGLISLTVIGGVTAVDGSTTIADPLLQESLSGSTLTQLGSPLLFDPTSLTGLTVRLQNVSDQEIVFSDALPGVSVLSGVNGLPGFASRTNVAAGGAGKTGAAGAEGAVSRTMIEMIDSVYAFSSPVSGSHGGGGGAATGVANNYLSITGASGAELASALASLHLQPGEWVDIPDFVRIAAFHRDVDAARIAFGFDLPTFTSEGVTVTCGAWTGSFSEAGGAEPPSDPPVALPEPAAGWMWPFGLLVVALCRGRFVAGD